jgi:hypothetical protein
MGLKCVERRNERQAMFALVFLLCCGVAADAQSSNGSWEARAAAAADPTPTVAPSRAPLPTTPPTPTPRFHEIKLGGENTGAETAPPRETSLSDVARNIKLQPEAKQRIVIIGQPQPAAPIEPGSVSYATPQERQRQAARYILAKEIYNLVPKANQLEGTLRAYFDACAGKYTVTHEAEQSSGIATGSEAAASAGVAVAGNAMAVGTAVSYREFVANWVQQKYTVALTDNETTVECRALLSSARSLAIELTNARDDALRRARSGGALPGDEREVLNTYGMNW